MRQIIESIVTCNQLREIWHIVWSTVPQNSQTARETSNINGVVSSRKRESICYCKLVFSILCYRNVNFSKNRLFNSFVFKPGKKLPIHKILNRKRKWDWHLFVDICETLNWKGRIYFCDSVIASCGCINSVIYIWKCHQDSQSLH